VKRRRLAWAGAQAAGAIAIASAIGVLAWPDGEPVLQAVEGSKITSGPSASKAQPPPATPGAQTAFADPLLGVELRQHIEALLLEASAAGDSSEPAVIKKRAALLVARHFPADQAVRASALVERYIDYRVALGSIRPPTDPGDPRALRSAIEARDRVRSNFFAPEENEALFAHDAELDQYTLARLEIERNGDLSKSQKEAALREAETGLSAAQRAQRADATSHLAVAEQTAAFDANGISDQARYAQRQAAHGDAAARNLAQLDSEERDWQTRLGNYDAARKSGASEQDLQRVRGQLFSESEQLRLTGALIARTQGAVRPQ
jgi:lipase chaperone LimK